MRKYKTGDYICGGVYAPDGREVRRGSQPVIIHQHYPGTPASTARIDVVEFDSAKLQELREQQAQLALRIVKLREKVRQAK